MKFQVKITATGEVRDKDGNLISNSDADLGTEVMELSEEQARALGYEGDVT